MEGVKKRLKQGGVNLTEDERSVLEKVADFAGLKWFSYVKRTYGDRLDKTAEHYYPFDRILDTETGEYMSVKYALKRIEGEIGADAVDCLDKREKNTYASLFERSGVDSKYLKAQYGGIFRNKGLFRRAVRWSAMDELADSFVNEDAKKLWDKEGYPDEVRNRRTGGISNMRWFRESDKDDLTEEEFDRISEVFRKCINM